MSIFENDSWPPADILVIVVVGLDVWDDIDLTEKVSIDNVFVTSSFVVTVFVTVVLDVGQIDVLVLVLLPEIQIKARYELYYVRSLPHLRHLLCFYQINVVYL